MTTHERAFEGLELGETSGNLLKEELLKVVQKRLKTNDVQIFVEFGAKIGTKRNSFAFYQKKKKLHAQQFVISGDNFNGEIYRVYFKRTDDDDAKKTSLILKSAPKNMARREKLNVRVLFLREIMLYDDVLSTFYNFQISKGVIPSENGFNEYPKCYKSISEFLYETVLLEDLKLRNFDLINHRTEPITFDHMSLLLKALGKFHAISFALKDQQPKKFKELSSVIFEPYWTIIEQPAVKQILVGMLGRMRSCLEEENRLDLVEKFEKLTGDDFRSKFYDLFQSTKAEPYAVICHGDLTVKNTMFRKDKQGKPVEIQFFDWQYSRYASPVTDVALYLFCCSSSELRAKHYDEFLKIYHGSLSDLLKRY